LGALRLLSLWVVGLWAWTDLFERLFADDVVALGAAGVGRFSERWSLGYLSGKHLDSPPLRNAT
jgi:hypothetical protein